jgi:hypothetical protein
MSTIQQKEARQVESFNVNEESPSKPRLVTASNATEAETKNSIGNRINTQPL